MLARELTQAGYAALVPLSALSTQLMLMSQAVVQRESSSSAATAHGSMEPTPHELLESSPHGSLEPSPHGSLEPAPHGPAATAQQALVVAGTVPPHLLQQFEAGACCDTASKQAAMEELVLTIADEG